MYIGKKNLMDALKVLTTDAIKFEFLELILGSGKTITVKEVMVVNNQVCGRRAEDGALVMLPDDEVIGISMGLASVSAEDKLPDLIAKLKTTNVARRAA